MHKLILSGQTLKMPGPKREIATDSIGQVVFCVEATEDWQGFTLTAQFTQDYETIDVLVVDGQFCLPPEIRYGEFSVSVYGVNGTVQRNTTIPLNLFNNKSGYTPHGKNTPPLTPDLYQQIVAQLGRVKSVNGVQPDENGNVKLDSADVVDNLETQDDSRALSANQGYVLAQAIETISKSITPFTRDELDEILV